MKEIWNETSTPSDHNSIARALCRRQCSARANLCGEHYRVEQPWARATPGGAKTGAVYMALINNSTSVDRLLGATTPLADKVQFHKETEDNGVSRMRQVQSMELEPGAKIIFKPRELHMMIVGLKQPLTVGQTFPLTLQFEKAGNIEVTVPIEGVGAMQHKDMGSMAHRPDDAMAHGLDDAMKK